MVDFAQNSSKKLCDRQKLRGENENLISRKSELLLLKSIEAQSEFLTEILHEKSSEITPKIHWLQKYD